MKRFAFSAVLLLALLLPLRAEPLNASLDVDASVTVTTFVPLQVFGNNANAWADPLPIREKVEKAGNYLIRIPGGSWGDVYHWNGKGSYDREGRWVPSDTEYAPSRLEKGMTLKYHASRAIDGQAGTAWRSHPDTDFPHAQWLYLNLGEKRSVDGLNLTWGDAKDRQLPHAKVFAVQIWDPKAERQWMPYGADQDAWITVKGPVRGRGGRQSVAFPATETQYVRLLLKESSAGPGGAYAVAEMQPTLGGKAVSLASWNPAVASSTDVVSSGMDDREVIGFEQFMDFLRGFSPHAEPLVIVNFGSGTAREAAAWVHYANRVKGYGIKYWEVGNEVAGDWEQGGPLNNADYARRYIAFYEAMKAEDPSILVFPNVGALEASGLYDGKACLRSFLDRLAKDGKDKEFDAVSLHQYPGWGQAVSTLLDAPRTDMPALAATIRSQLADFPALADKPVWITEFNTSDHVQPHDISVHLENGIWLAGYLGEFIRAFGPRAWANMWDIQNGGSAIHQADGADHGYLQAESGPFQYQERADYWAMTQLAAHWALPGDARDHALVQVASSERRLASYAALRPDGKLSLLVVNQDPTASYRADLRIQGFRPAKKGVCWTFDADHYAWETATAPYHADPDRPPTRTDLKGLRPSFRHVFAPYSITVLEFTPQGADKK